MPDPVPPSAAPPANPPAAAPAAPLLASPPAAPSTAEAPLLSAPPAAPAAQAAPPAPEPVYDFKLPETMAKDNPGIVAFTALAKEAKIAPEAAQKIVDFELKRQSESLAAWDKMQADWTQQLKCDAELGGAKLPQTLAAANKALDTFGPTARQVLLDAGLGNHPAVIGLLARCAAAIREDSSVRGTPAAPEKSIAQLMFDKSL